MVAIPGGTFTMGANASSTETTANYPFTVPSAAPVRRVEVPPFWLAAPEITAGEFGRFDAARAGKGVQHGKC